VNKTVFAGAVLILVATAAFAHQGVKNATVKARMDGMSAIADNMKVLGNMAKGKVAFDAATAQAAARAIAEEAGQTPALFKAQEDDPKSEAKPGIWDNFSDFSTKSDELKNVALTLSTSLDTLDDVRAGVGALGRACKACHSRYRE